MTFPNLNLKARQQGAATLFVVMMLAIIMAVISLTTARTGLMEQKVTGNDLRAREVQEAAEAGLEYGVGWANNNSIPNTVTCSSGSLPAGCPTLLTTVAGSSTGESYVYTLTYTKGADSVKVTSAAQGVADSSIAATSETVIKQTPMELFDLGMPMPPPWVIAGCITGAPTGTPDTFVLNATNPAVLSGTSSDPSCLPQGNLDVTVWTDANGNGVKDAGEEGAITGFNRDTFPCPGTHCAWNYVFKMDLQDAIDMATNAGHVYSGSIPCGPANSSPSIYVINNSGPITGADISDSGSCTGTGVDEKTIGAPDQPILLIIPSANDCPRFNGGITIYGIIYFESATECASNGWGGAKVYGSVIWEGDVDKPNANSEFIEVDLEDDGDLNTVFNIGMDSAARIPGTWKDF
jgi:Tfp pilus assembly protein PilX